MKINMFWWIGCLVFTVSQVQAQQSPAKSKPTVEQQFDQLAWLVGTWNRVNSKPGRSAYEKWEKNGLYSMQGMGVTKKESDSVITEKLQLLIKDGSIWYVADVAGNKSPVWFRVTIITPDGFTGENPKHDFPTKINYLVEGNKLTAVVSNQERSLHFNFSRQTP